MTPGIKPVSEYSLSGSEKYSTAAAHIVAKIAGSTKS